MISIIAPVYDPNDLLVPMGVLPEMLEKIRRLEGEKETEFLKDPLGNLAIIEMALFANFAIDSSYFSMPRYTETGQY
jgi:hypothetical protein